MFKISAKTRARRDRVGARQSFEFSRQIIWFLGNNRALPLTSISDFE